MNILKSNSENIKKAVEIIKNGGLVSFPTETVYGLGADGLNPIAVSKIFEVKGRPSFNPLILHVSSIEMMKSIVEIENEKVLQLINNFWPGPLTLVLKKKEIVPEIVTAGHPTVAVRMPNHPIALELIETFGSPIAAPSANSFSQLSPTRAEHVKNQLGEKVAIILDGGQSTVGVESTIISCTENKFYLLRPGGLDILQIENITGHLTTKQDVIKPDSPGQLFFHYSPKTPIKFFDEALFDKYKTKKLGFLKFKKGEYENPNYVYKYLSENGDLHNAATNLFVKLHEFEDENLDIIFVDYIPETGLGIAIMDRLTKATNRYIDFK